MLEPAHKVEDEIAIQTSHEDKKRELEKEEYNQKLQCISTCTADTTELV